MPQSPQTLTHIKQTLSAHGLRPKHRLGQNFLHDHNHLKAIIKAGTIKENDLVLEVGPGTGTLSQQILETGAKLLAVEIDQDLKPILQAALHPYGDKAKLLYTDVLKSKHIIAPQIFADLQELAQTPAPTFKLIANLPYNVASPLLANLVVDYINPGPNTPRMTTCVVMIQKEVAQRLNASPGTKSYGPLGIMIQALCDVEHALTLKPGCFWPPPKVDSAVVVLHAKEKPLTNNPKQLHTLLHVLFTKRRKQIGAILGRSFPFPSEMQQNLRPEQLSVEQLIHLASIYHQQEQND